MATEVQINAVVDSIIAAFNGDPALWTAFLKRAKLETELAQIESDIRNKQAEANESATEYVDELSVLATDRAAKVAEIDALA